MKNETFVNVHRKVPAKQVGLLYFPSLFMVHCSMF